MRIDRPEDYYRVSLERMGQAWSLYRGPDQQSYGLAMYVGGVAVECMLRAFKRFKDQVFDERHDLSRLFRTSRMLDFDPDSLRARKYNAQQIEEYFRELRATAFEVYRLWSNDYRFASEERMRAHLKSMQLDRGIRGDFLKKRAEDLLTAAQTIIDAGVLQWKSLKKSNPS